MNINFISKIINFILKTLPRILCVAGVYFLSARLGLQLATVNNFASPVWPASGIAISFLLLWGPQMFFGVLIGAFAANYFLDNPINAIIGIGVGNALEALVAIKIFHFMTRVTERLGPYSRIVVYVSVATFATVVSASIGTTCLLLGNVIDFDAVRVTWLTWWTGDTLGALIIFPAAAKIWRREYKDFSIPLKKLPHLAFVILIAFGLCAFVFNTSVGAPYLFVIFLSLLIATIWLSSFWVYVVSIGICAYAIFSTKYSLGPFYGGDLNENLLHLQLFLAGVGLTTVVLVTLQTEKLLKIPSLALIFGWLLTGMTFYSFYQASVDNDLEHFTYKIEKAEKDLHENLASYIRLLETGSGLFAASESVTRKEWQAFTSRLRFQDQYPGINGIGIVVPVQDAEAKRELVAFERSHGVADFSLRDVYFAPEDKKIKNPPLDLAIRFIEPFEDNRKALGLLISSEKSRLEGALKARDQGTPTITDEFVLIQDAQARPGFALFSPFYKNNMPIQTLEQRRKAFKGLVFSPVIMEKFVNSTLDKYDRELDLRIFFGREVDPKREVFTSGKWSKDERKFVRSDIKLGGKPVTILWKRGPDFKTQSSVVASWAGFCGSLIAVLLAIVLSSLENITERAKKIAEETTFELSQREKQLQERQMALVASSRMSSLGQMASGMAHEINNPLAIIAGKAQHLDSLMSEQPINIVKVQQHINAINSNVERIAKIIKGLRSIARDVPDDPFRNVRAADILQDTLELCSSRFKHHDVALIVPEQIPGDLLCYARPEQVVQVLLNLLNNAFDAVEDLPDKWVKLEVVAVQEKIHFEVTDAGKGLSKEMAEKIFDPFFTTKDVGKGTGLGLSISRGIIEKHRGRIYMDTSAENTKIIIELESRGTHA